MIKNKNTIELIGDACVGCRSCEQICPKQCILMKKNEEGFIIPSIDTKKCINCGQCLIHCPSYKHNLSDRKPLKVFGLKSKDKTRIVNSASGGASDEFAKYILQLGGIVFGAAFTDNLHVKHILIENINDLYKIQSSKYVQSDLENIYHLVKQYLLKGRIILFTGTPCQIAGLNAFLEYKPYDNLFTIDLICHGVPSPLFWQKYIEYQEKALGEKINYYNFRYKLKRGWGVNFICKTNNKEKMNSLYIDKYGKHFLEGDCFRECCYKCSYANISRVADITIGDFWGIEKIDSSFYSNDGVSLVLLNTEKGEKLINKIFNNVEIKDYDIQQAVPYQTNLRMPTPKPKKRDSFYSKINEETFVKDIKVGLILKERLKVMFPKSIITFIKRLLK